MDESDACPPAPDSRLAIHQARPLLTEMGECLFDGDDGIGDMVQALTPVRQEPAHRGFRADGHQQLDERAADREHGLLHALTLHNFPIDRLDLVALPIPLDGSIEVVDRHRYVIEVEKLHMPSVLRRIGPVTCAPVPSGP